MPFLSAPLAGPLISAGGSILGGLLGGGSAKLQKLPPPAPLNPEMLALFKQYAGGLAKPSFGTMTEMAKTGMPTDVGPAWEALMSAGERMRGEGRGNILEQFGSTGMRYSQPLMNSLVDYESQQSKDLLSILANWSMQASESARGRQLTAAGMGTQMFSESAQAYYPTAAPYLQQGGVGSAISAGAGSFSQMLMMLKMLGIFGQAGSAGTNFSIGGVSSSSGDVPLAG